MKELKQVTLYTDGACSGNPGAGGWGAVLIFGEHSLEISGGEAETTNNRMELTAVIEGLQRSQWKKSDKTPVLNSDLWKQLIALTKMHEVTFHKVKGHADNELNNRCDELARNAIDKIKVSLDK